MSTESVEAFLTKGGEDQDFRQKYNLTTSIDEFIKFAKEDGFDFTEEELMKVVQGNGDTFESYGNPPKRSIWY